MTSARIARSTRRMTATSVCGMQNLGPAHPVGGAEEFSGVGDELAVARMIEGLDADDPSLDRRNALLQVAKELELCRARAGHQNLAGIQKCLGNAFKIMLF